MPRKLIFAVDNCGNLFENSAEFSPKNLVFLETDLAQFEAGVLQHNFSQIVTFQRQEDVPCLATSLSINFFNDRGK
jgi:hypothetical protein